MPRVTLHMVGSIGLIEDFYEQDIPANAWSRVQNARFNEKGARAFLGHTLAMEDGPELAITPLWVENFPSTLTGSPRWVYADNNKVYVAQEFSHTNITRASGDYNATERWQGTVYNGLGILNNGFDAPQLWSPIDDSQVLVDLTNWPTNYRCRFIKPFKAFLIAGYIYDTTAVRPYRVLWSHPADPGSVPADWDVADPASDAGQFDFAKTTGHVVDGLEMTDLFIVYKEDSVRAMQLTGTGQVFRNFEITGATGILWKSCVAQIPRGHVVASWEDLYVHAGSAQSVQSVLDGRVRRWIIDQRDPDNYQNSFITTNWPEREVWYCFPQVGHTYASVAVVWNWKDGQVGIRELPEVPFAAAGPVTFEVS